LTCTTTSGGKGPGAAGPGKILQPRESLLEEALPPEADDLPACAEPIGDLLIGKAPVGEEDHLCANNLIIR
jgi:hypothetical protein